MSDDDVALVRRCRRGDDSAIVALVQRFHADVYGLCYRMLHHRHDAEDATQEVFLRVFRSLDKWDKKRPLRPWVLAIAVNRCKTLLMQRGKRPELVEYLQETTVAKPADDSGELKRELQGALSSLREEYRAVFVLYHERELPYDEIAGTLGKPVGTIKTWLHRARLEILEFLKRRGMIAESDYDVS